MGLFPEAFNDKPRFLSTCSLCNIQNLFSKRKKRKSLPSKIIIIYANWLAARLNGQWSLLSWTVLLPVVSKPFQQLHLHAKYQLAWYLNNQILTSWSRFPLALAGNLKDIHSRQQNFCLKKSFLLTGGILWISLYSDGIHVSTAGKQEIWLHFQQECICWQLLDNRGHGRTSFPAGKPGNLPQDYTM